MELFFSFRAVPLWSTPSRIFPVPVCSCGFFEASYHAETAGEQTGSLRGHKHCPDTWATFSMQGTSGTWPLIVSGSGEGKEGSRGGHVQAAWGKGSGSCGLSGCGDPHAALARTARMAQSTGCSLFIYSYHLYCGPGAGLDWSSPLSSRFVADRISSLRLRELNKPKDIQLDRSPGPPDSKVIKCHSWFILLQIQVSHFTRCCVPLGKSPHLSELWCLQIKHTPALQSCCEN